MDSDLRSADGCLKPLSTQRDLPGEAARSGRHEASGVPGAGRAHFSYSNNHTPQILRQVACVMYVAFGPITA